MATDNQVAHPDHYTHGGIETIDYIRAKLTYDEFIGFLKGNVIKYVSRAGKKGSEIQDIEKAGWYMKALAKAVSSKS